MPVRAPSERFAPIHAERRSWSALDANSWNSFWAPMKTVVLGPRCKVAENDPPGTKKLSQQELWDLIAYVRSLPYEAISQPARVEDQMLKEVQ